MTHGRPKTPAPILALHGPRHHLALRVLFQVRNAKDGYQPGIVFAEPDPIVELLFDLKRGDTVGDGMVGLSRFDFCGQRLDCGVPAPFPIISLPVKIAASPLENLGTIFVRSKSRKMNCHQTTASLHLPLDDWHSSFGHKWYRRVEVPVLTVRNDHD